MFRRILILIFLASVPLPAVAQDYEDASGRSLTIAGDARIVASDGERSWLDGGYGKARFGGDGEGDTKVRPRLIAADAVWKPQLSWTLGATIAVTAQDGQQHPVDLSEAYVSYRRGPHGDFHFSGRAGLFWPPVSLEHSGPEWAVAETITPSAINSWIGEEVKVGALEATASWPVAGGRLALTGAAFGLNDTAGTLLAFRGWALHDEKATGFGLQPLPPLYDIMPYAQAARTRPVIELDDRPGYYARIGWAKPDAIRLHILHYDNRGDPEAVTPTLQWGWRTRFVDVGATGSPAAHLHLTAQAMSGSTRMGFPRGGRIWVDTRFRSAYLLATRDLGERASLSGRVEAFGTKGRGSILAAPSGEDGWAATIAGRRALTDFATLFAEAQHIDSNRGDRAFAGIAPRQDQTVIQLALRVRR